MPGIIKRDGGTQLTALICPCVCNWTPSWAGSHGYDEIRICSDGISRISDSEILMNRFRAYYLRNGNRNNEYKKSMRKALFLRTTALCILHWFKSEDIINRGNTLLIKSI